MIIREGSDFVYILDMGNDKDQIIEFYPRIERTSEKYNALRVKGLSKSFYVLLMNPRIDYDFLEIVR